MVFIDFILVIRRFRCLQNEIFPKYLEIRFLKVWLVNGNSEGGSAF
jgi:hypothetical protein